MDLAGKHIIITGASSGIGRETCIQAAKCGAKISLVVRNEDKMRDTISLMHGTGHEAYKFDLNNTNEIEGLVASIVENSGKIDGLVHCAGISIDKPVKLATPDFVENMMRIHYFAFAELMRAASSNKRTNKSASYVGVSSIASFQGNKAQSAYSSAKGAMNAAVHSFAKELAPKEIRVNTVAFGMVDTAMYKGFIDVGGDDDKLLQEQYLGIIPVEYAGKVICFMLSDISKYMTGGTLIYDAGRLS